MEVGLAHEIVRVRVRYADLVVTGQVDPDSLGALRCRGLAIALRVDPGRPNLIVPYAGMFASLGKGVLVAWNGSREAARILHGTMPF